MRPANSVCDALNVTDPNERAMVRMLVNTLIWITVGAAAIAIVWML